MRTNGDPYWLRGALRAAVLACALVGLTAAPAAAATTRHAVPTGGAPGGACGPAAACTLKAAIEGAAAGDTVSVAPGAYSVSSSIAGSDVTVTGGTSEDTAITGAANLSGPVLSLTGSTTVRNLTVRSTNSQAALDLDGTADAVEVYSSAGRAMTLRGAGTIDNSVVHTSAPSATALRVTAGLGSNPLVRHATVVATGSGSTAIDSSGLASQLAVRGSIANGVANDVIGEFLNDVDLAYSAWRTAKSSNYSSGAGNVNAAAAFVDPTALEFQQAPSSPTVNRAQRGGTPATLDLARRPRDIGAAPDIGAYELPQPPTATTGAAASVGTTNATVAATTNPRSVSTTFWVEYGPTASFGSSTSPVSAGAGATDVSANAGLTGLLPGTTYHYRTVAANEWGTATGATQTFETQAVAPVATADAPTGVGAASARLEGTVDRGGAPTTAYFEWGPTSAYGSTTTVEDLGDGAAVSMTGVVLTGLLPGTQYHYRVVAQNAQGTVHSAGRSFTTDTRAPGVTLGAPSGITESGATVAGSVDPGGDATSWRFDYGVGAYDATATGDTVTGTAPQPVARALSGLVPGTAYQYRLVAQNGRGSSTQTGSFTTEVAAPAAATGDALVDARSATVGGQVNTGGGSGTWTVEYGETASYGRRSGPHGAAASAADQNKVASLTSLEPATTYHYRFVATNSKGTAAGRDATFTTEADPPGDSGKVTEPDGGGQPGDEPAPGERQADGLPAPDPTPPVGRSANAAPAGGTVRVRVPGSRRYVTLTAGAGIPMGSVVDATHGQVTITSAADAYGRTQSANFGGSEFVVRQKRAAQPITDIVLTGGSMACSARPLAKSLDAEVFAAARRKWSRRRLWGNGHGRFRTRGRRAAATVRGTHWLTEDRCDGTLVRVKRGLVEVRDLVRRRTVMVPAGKKYLAKNPAKRRKRGGSGRR